MKKIKPSFVFPILWLIISTILLTLPGKAFPKENWLEKIWFDKWVHIGMFAIMVFLACWSYPRWGTKKRYINLRKLQENFILIGLGCLCYGVVMEFVQKYFIPNRSFDVGDIVADGIGCAVGVFYSLKRYKPKPDLK